MAIIRTPRELMYFFNTNREIQRFFTDLSSDRESYAHKIVGGTEDNIVIQDSNGDMKDGGISLDEVESRAFFFSRNY